METLLTICCSPACMETQMQDVIDAAGEVGILLTIKRALHQIIVDINPPYVRRFILRDSDPVKLLGLRICEIYTCGCKGNEDIPEAFKILMRS